MSANLVVSNPFKAAPPFWWFSIYPVFKTEPLGFSLDPPASFEASLRKITSRCHLSLRTPISSFVRLLVETCLALQNKLFKRRVVKKEREFRKEDNKETVWLCIFIYCIIQQAFVEQLLCARHHSRWFKGRYDTFHPHNSVKKGDFLSVWQVQWEGTWSRPGIRKAFEAELPAQWRTGGWIERARQRHKPFRAMEVCEVSQVNLRWWIGEK